MISWLKAQAFKAIDALDRTADPFQEFTRPPQPKYPETLAQKAAKFEADLLANFQIRNNTLVNYRIPQDNRLPLDIGDQAFHHGLAVAMMAMKYWVTKSSNDLLVLERWMVGLADHQPYGFLIRGLDENGRAEYDASFDQASGHLAGLYFAFMFGESNVIRLVRSLVSRWADNIIEHGYALANLDGRPTQFGRMINGWMTEPCSLTLCLAILQLAYDATLDSKYIGAYADLHIKYGSMCPYAYTRLASWLGHEYDLHRAAIHLRILDCLDPRKAYRDGLARLWQMTRKSGNAWVGFLCSASPEDIAVCKKVLSEFTLEDKQYDLVKDNSRVVADKILWDGQACSRQPLPAWQRSGVDFYWMRNAYTLDGGFSLASSRYHLGDWLVAYWGLRSANMISANE